MTEASLIIHGYINIECQILYDNDHGDRVTRTILSSVACIPFSTYSLKLSCKLQIFFKI